MRKLPRCSYLKKNILKIALLSLGIQYAYSMELRPLVQFDFFPNKTTSHEKVNSVIRTGFYTAVVLGVLIMTVLLLASPFLLNLMKQNLREQVNTLLLFMLTPMSAWVTSLDWSMSRRHRLLATSARPLPRCSLERPARSARRPSRSRRAGC